MNSETEFVLSEEDFTLLEQLPICGCGRPGLVLDHYRHLLHLTDWGVNRESDGPPGFEALLGLAGGNETLLYLSAYVLDHIKATEHGGGVGGAWITDKGKRLLEILDRYEATGYDATPCYIPELATEPGRDEGPHQSP